MAARDKIVIVGGFNGEYLVKHCATGAIQTGVITRDANGITNYIEIESKRGPQEALICSNDCHLRVLDLTSFLITQTIPFEWALNVI